MKRKLIKVTMLIFVFSVIGFLGYQVVAKAQEKEAIVERIKTIPEFSFTTLSNVVFTKRDVKPNVPVVFLYVNSECDYCQNEARNISESIDQFRDVQLFFVSDESVEKIKAFSEQFNLNNQKNIVFFVDNNNEFSKRFDANSIPYHLIYDENQNLIVARKGQLTAVNILKYINGDTSTQQRERN